MTATKSTGHSSKHVSSKKHEGTSKHSPTAKKTTKSGTKGHVTTKAKHATHAKARGFAINDLLPVCAAEAVAQSLRLLGQRVSPDEVEALWLAAGGWDGASLPGTLAAAAVAGLAGFRPGAAELVVAATPVPVFGRVPLDFVGSGADLAVQVVVGAEEHPVVAAATGEYALYRQSGHAGVMPGAPRGEYLSGHALILGADGAAPTGCIRRGPLECPSARSDGSVSALILGVSVPGPHCVLATADGWWSWGRLYQPWPCAIEEAVAVSWS